MSFNWLQRHGVNADEWAKPVVLSAGGVVYVTARGTLRGLEAHPLFGPIVSGKGRPGEDGAHFIDCDGILFRFILNFLRGGGAAVSGTEDKGEKEEMEKAAVLEGSGDLCVPEGFAEWEQLLLESRRLRLPTLESHILARYEYQRMVFLRTLPLGVRVRWPTTVIIREPLKASSSAVSHSPANAPAPAGPAPPAAAAIPTAADDNRPSSSPVDPASTSTSDARQPPSPAVSSASAHGGTLLADKVARHALQVSIVPAIPSLRVAEDGRSVLYGSEGRVLRDLDQLVCVLVSMYGYRIEHWQEREGVVFLSLPSGPSV